MSALCLVLHEASSGQYGGLLTGVTFGAGCSALTHQSKGDTLQVSSQKLIHLSLRAPRSTESARVDPPQGAGEQTLPGLTLHSWLVTPRTRASDRGQERLTRWKTIDFVLFI